MKYLLMIYTNAEQRWTGSPDDVRGLRALFDLERELTESGELIGSEALAEPTDAKIIRVRNGVPAVTDGPFAEAKEYLAGYLMIECASSERAVEIATRMPPAHTHAVELRPIADKAEIWALVRE